MSGQLPLDWSVRRAPVEASRAAAPVRLRALPVRERMAQLARGFRMLDGTPGLDPWDAAALLDYATGPGRGNVYGSTAMLQAVAFLLTVWNQHACEELPPRNGRPVVFDAVAAFYAWDQTNRDAALVWFNDPWGT